MTAELQAHFHVGIVVADVRAARARLSAQLGVQWGPVMHLDATDYRAADGTDLRLPTTICYSTGTPGLELIEEVPGTVWVRNDHSNLHHIGFWTDDLGEATATLGAAGCPLQLCGRTGADAPTAFTYQWDAELAIRIELVDAGMREAMSFLFTPEPGTG